MRMILLTLPLMVGAAHADPVQFPLVCNGASPDWSLTVNEDGAVFDFLHQSELTLALQTQASGADWPIAMTLIGRGDSAIVTVEPATCDTGTHSARILTQRGETPMLLVGCCTMSAP